MELEREIKILQEIQKILNNKEKIPFNYYLKMINMIDGSPISKSTMNDAVNNIAESFYCIYNTESFRNHSLNRKRVKIYQSSLTTICFYKRLRSFLDIDINNLSIVKTNDPVTTTKNSDQMNINPGKKSIQVIKNVIRHKTFSKTLYPLYISLIKNCRINETQWDKLGVNINSDINPFFNKDYPNAFCHRCDDVYNYLLSIYFPISLNDLNRDIEYFIKLNTDILENHFLIVSLKSLCTHFFSQALFFLPSTTNSFWTDYHQEISAYLNSNDAKVGTISNIILQDYFETKYNKYLIQESEIINSYFI